MMGTLAVKGLKLKSMENFWFVTEICYIASLKGSGLIFPSSSYMSNPLWKIIFLKYSGRNKIN